ncbi:hypothetical protein AB0M46_44145 [Dactylosporangium sp. NPDC051485]|uniref:hypothetical protein n=1 Tax=Dactylosporangium sp. NPDC051485 TaxID=3154846 RepID=UPI00344282F4
MTERFVFRLGEAYDDLEPVFVVDGRDYPDDAAARADVEAARRALDERRLIADYEASAAAPEAPRSPLPTWREWRARHIDGGAPIGVRPRPDVQETPPGWAAMGRWLETSQAWLDAQLAAAAGAVPGARVRRVREPEPRRVGRASVVLAEERYQVDVEYLAVPATLDPIAAWLSANGWTVVPDGAALRATNAGYTVTAVWTERYNSVRLVGSSPAVDATYFDPQGGSAGAAHV